MYENLKAKNIGNFSDQYYWSSSFNGTYLNGYDHITYASHINFKNGSNNDYKYWYYYTTSTELYVRAIRAFWL